MMKSPYFTSNIPSHDLPPQHGQFWESSSLFMKRDGGGGGGSHYENMC